MIDFESNSDDAPELTNKVLRFCKDDIKETAVFLLT